MITQFKDWYSLDEVAEMFECKVEDINHFIEARKLNFVLWLEDEPGYIHDGNTSSAYPPCHTRLFGLWDFIAPTRRGEGPIVYQIDADNPEEGLHKSFHVAVKSRWEALELVHEKKYPFMIYHEGYDKYLLATQVYTLGCNSKTAKKVILRTEFERFKSTMTSAKDHSSMIAEVIDKEHPWYSENLAHAINAWFALYADHEGHKGDNAFKPHGGHKKMIEKWLQDHFDKSITPTARQNIAAIVSPCKFPGQGSCPPWHDKKHTSEKKHP